MKSRKPVLDFKKDKDFKKLEGTLVLTKDNRSPKERQGNPRTIATTRNMKTKQGQNQDNARTKQVKNKNKTSKKTSKKHKHQI